MSESESKIFGIKIDHFWGSQAPHTIKVLEEPM